MTTFLVTLVLLLFAVGFIVVLGTSEERTRKFLDANRREILELGASGVLPDEIAERMSAAAGFVINASEIMSLIRVWEEQAVKEAEFRNRCRTALCPDAPKAPPVTDAADASAS